MCTNPCDNQLLLSSQMNMETESPFVKMHDGMMKIAMNDAYNQQDLAQKAKLQVKI